MRIPSGRQRIRSFFFSPVSYLLTTLLFLLTASSGEAQQAVSLVLENGMRFVLQENHANPMIASVVAVRAGSRYEEADNNGVSHLLEHLLFSGTRSRSRQEIAAEIRNRSGYLNAFTRKDATAYILLIPKTLAEEGLEIQADMLFNSIVPEEELAKERRVVLEEIHQNLDNPDYRAEIFFDQMAYKPTPYSQPILGFKNIIATVSRQEVLDFYHRHYVPNNMVALITGDFELEEMKGLVERVFGPYPPRHPLPQIPTGLSLQANDQIHYRSHLVPQTTLTLAFPGPAYDDPDYHAFDLMTRLLTLGEESPLNQALRGGESPLALDLKTNLALQEGGSSYVLEITLGSGELQGVGPSGRESAGAPKASERGSSVVPPSTSPNPDALKQTVQKVIRKVIEVFQGMAERRLDRKEVLRVLTGLKAEEYRLREKLHYWGMAKAPVLALAGYEFVWTYPERMEKVKPEEMVRAARRFFSQPHYVGTVLFPQEAKEGRAENGSEAEKEELQREVLANGLTIIARRNSATGVFAVHVLAKGRSSLEPPGKAGAADLLSRLLLKGTPTRTATQISRTLSEIGAEVKLVDDPRIPHDDLYTSPAYSYIRFETIAEHAEEGLDILADLIHRPSLPPQEIERAREEMLRIIARREGNPSQLAHQLLYAELFRGYSFSRDELGTRESIELISRKDLVELHRKLYAPNNLIIALVGDLSASRMVSIAARRFNDLGREDIPLFQPPDLGKLKARRVVKALESEQASIELGLPLAGVENPDAAALRVMGSVLSGRLTDRLREVQGLAYSVGATVHLLPGFGWLEVSLRTAPQNLPVAQEGILKEMRGLREAPVGREELEKAVNSYWGSTLMRRLSSINQAYYACLDEFLGLPAGFDRSSLKGLRQVTPQDIQRLARKYLGMERAVTAVVGGPGG